MPHRPARDAVAGGTTVAVRVPAKVNLHLGVGPLRADGFHELVNVFHAVDLVDELDAHPGDGVSLRIGGEGADHLPTDGDNLVCRAAQLLATTAGVPADVRFELLKAIPVAGGMAGGSADAAAALVACARLWGLDLAADELHALAAQLGSDVPFALLGGTAIGTGRGELLRPVPTAADLHWVFALADTGVSAGAAYGELDRLRSSGLAPEPLGPAGPLLDALAAGDVDGIAARLGNDLEPAALSLVPRLADTLAAGEAGSLARLVSGSGPTCAFLCEDARAAAALAAHLESAGVCRSTRTARGPVGGVA
ncbi:4-(cytidine 5'-diphospho)-2-C-methyl-D-erythritol kinase [Jatrophihabitans fulvus]